MSCYVVRRAPFSRALQLPFEEAYQRLSYKGDVNLNEKLVEWEQF
jgi:hypothetical protein